MKKYCEFQKVMSILLISVFVTTTPGCYSIKPLTNNDIPYPDKCHYILHVTTVKYNLTNAEISGGFLTGYIDKSVIMHNKDKTVHFYVSPASAMVKDGEKIKVSTENLKRIEVHEYSAVITGILVGVIVLTVVGIVYAVKNMEVDYLGGGI